MPTTYFSGDEIDVYCLNEKSESDNILIYFDHLGNRKSNLIQIEDSEERAQGPARAFCRLGLKIFIFIALRGHWYQNIETEKILRKILFENPEKHYIHIGYSMGGFAAVNFSYINRATVLAFQPQSLLGHDVPMTPAYQECYDKLLNKSFSSNIEKGLCIDTSGFVFYDNHNPIDSWHANRICNLTALKGMAIPFAGHATSNVINRDYKIYDLVRDFSNKELTETSFYNKFDITRTDEYISNTIRKCIQPFVNNEYGKCLRSKLNICYETGLYSYGASEILKVKIDKSIIDYELIKIIIKILLKNRNFNDLINILKRIKSISDNESDQIKNILLVGIGISLNCVGKPKEGTSFLIKSLAFNNSDYFALWHLDKFLHSNVKVVKFIKSNATSKQLKSLRL